VPSVCPAVPVVGVVAKTNFVAVAASKSRVSKHSTAVAGRERMRSRCREALEPRVPQKRLTRLRFKYFFQILITAMPYERDDKRHETDPTTRSSA
jgi:hypothetical protein